MKIKLSGAQWVKGIMNTHESRIHCSRIDVFRRKHDRRVKEVIRQPYSGQ